MTKVMKQITHEFTGVRKANHEPFLTCPFVAEQDFYQMPDMSEEVVFSLHWKCIGFVRFNDDLPYVRQEMLEGFRRAIFSDVEDRIIEIQHSLYEMDNDSAMEKCSQLMRYLKEV